ncbi:MAG: class I SAM-dependent RNA methyltransferase [Sphingomonadales bacterium]|nr:class I SAM-dependent RNA methyltransferase [Sphingomonadales bacterium]
MMDAEEIIRIAAKGDGLTASGRHSPGSAPGDMLLDDGTLIAGPHRAEPACRHYGKCGGCQLQHIDEESLAGFVRDRVAHAAIALEPETITPAHLSPPHSRRRATLHAGRVNGALVIGFRQEGSHALVGIAECPVLHPRLYALVAPLKAMLARQSGREGGRLAIDIELTLADQGVDLSLKGLEITGLEATEAWLDFARAEGLARLAFDQGYGPEPLWEPEPATVTLSGVPVPLPPGAFLQATADGEAALAAAACEWLAGTPTVADLFAGLGTFSFALAKQGAKVLAAEADRAAHLACKAAAGAARLPVHALHRDLFRNPLLEAELNRFAAVLIDPPRAGAREQVIRIAQSTVPRVVYISCNPGSWARDAARLVEGGYRLKELRPVGQFRWSTHVELASLFVREAQTIA